ncbi:Nucleolar transcription factor 1 [Oryzias melastigma]|uniref:Nucleolar transcription factor 1 n=1 Tax=Oryzias melastigma TaxID=30732 RepID=A0A3B3DZP4_ORYME|nr:nucleolar transcription factor 1 [Oryzias melastigma]KAF6735375.1 Nucleolar transcription factor 1 [Oryzias melastigma]
MESALEWTPENLQKLFASLKASIPETEEASIYSRGLKRVDWEKVAFPPFSADQCREMWTSFMLNMRKVRTLKEIVEEAESLVSNPNTDDTIQPQFPKIPRPPNVLYFEKNLEKFQRRHPERDTQKLLKSASKKFNKLPEEEKAKYEEKYSLECAEYNKKMQSFCQNYPGFTPQKIKKRDLPASVKKSSEKHPDLPPKPPTNGYLLFCKEQSLSVRSLEKSRFIKEWARRWRDLSQPQKKNYADRCRELNEEYNVKMNAYLERFDEETRQQFIEKNKITMSSKKKSARSRALKRWLDEPKMPSSSGNTIFIQEQMQLLKEKIPITNERFCEVNKMWKSLSEETKEEYKEKRKNKIQQYSEELQNWFLAMTPQKRKEYWKSNPSKRKYLGVNEKFRKDMQSCKTSDSEDEEIVFSSSEEEDNTLILGKEEDYEEEDDIEIHMFEI